MTSASTQQATPFDSEPVQIIDRASGQIFEERVFGAKQLRWLYGSRLGRTMEHWVTRRRWFNRLYGLGKRMPWTRRQLPEFVATYGIDADEAEKPLAAYRSLDELFARRLRLGARTVDPSPERLLTPAEGRLRVVPLRDDAVLQVKRCRLSLAELLGSRRMAARYVGGCAAVIRLAPADYHRFHFPAQGEAGRWRTLGRHLHSVHPIALRAGTPSFANARVLSELRTERFGVLGLVEIGALAVGTIVQTYAPGAVCRGQEKGYFRFGGSTVVVLCEPGRVSFDQDLVDNSERGLETLVRVGSSIGRAEVPSESAEPTATTA